MNKLSKKQMIALYIVVAVIFVCLIAAFIMLKKDSNQNDSSTTKANATTAETQVETEDTSAEVTVGDMMTELTPMLALTSTTSLDADKIAYYYEVEETDMEECAGIIGDVALADELVIMKAKDGAVEKLEAGAWSRLESQKSSFQDYIPEQFKRLESAQVVVQGNYVMFVCCNDVDSVVEKFKAMAE